MTLEEDLAAAKAALEHIEAEIESSVTHDVAALATSDLPALSTTDVAAIEPTFAERVMGVVHTIEHRAFGRPSAEHPVPVTTITGANNG